MRPALIATLVVLLAASGSVALGEQPEPWAEGVSQDRQDRALALFRAGNELFVAGQCGRALVSYRQALGLWDHPAIRYNIGVCMVDIEGSALAAHRHFRAALRHGAGPLGDDKYRQARRYSSLLRARLGRLEIECNEPGAEVKLDGKAVFTAPGRESLLVEPGAHQVVADKQGYATSSVSVRVAAGARRELEVSLWKPGDLERPMPQWVPISLMASGAVLVAAAVPFKIASVGNAGDFDDALAEMCPTGCSEDQLSSETVDLRSRARWQDRVAISGFVVGGAALAAGVTLFVLNSPRRPRTAAWVPAPRPGGLAWSF